MEADLFITNYEINLLISSYFNVQVLDSNRAFPERPDLFPKCFLNGFLAPKFCSEISMKRLLSAIAFSTAFVIPSAWAASDIVDTAASAGSFNTLVTAIKAAGLVETLKGPGPFTVFAPTDDAFAKIPKADLDALLADKKKLAKVLTYHVVPGSLKAKDVMPGAVKTVEGGDIKISTFDGKVMVNKANVVTADVEASNGVIHAIDGVLMPK